jgi:putative membrane protein
MPRHVGADFPICGSRPSSPGVDGSAERQYRSSNMVTLILVWILNAVALLAVAYLLPGITVASFGSALIAALVLGLVNMLVKPVLVLLTLPITIVTLGLFLIVINALLFWFVGSVLKGFQVNGFWWAVGGAILYSIISGLLTKLIP